MRYAKYSCALAMLTLRTPAFAQEPPDEDVFGRAGQWTIGAERLMGFSSSTQTEGEGDAESETSVSAFGLFTSLSGGPYNFPRLSFDYFLADGIGLGVGLIYATDTFESRPSQGVATESKRTLVSFNTRVSYVVMFDPAKGVWLRLGFTAFSETYEKSSKVAGTGINLEAFYVWSPAPYVAIPVGLVIDRGLAGNRSFEGENPPDPIAVSASNVGLMTGLAVYF